MCSRILLFSLLILLIPPATSSHLKPKVGGWGESMGGVDAVAGEALPKWAVATGIATMW